MLLVFLHGTSLLFSQSIVCAHPINRVSPATHPGSNFIMACHRLASLHPFIEHGKHVFFVVRITGYELEPGPGVMDIIVEELQYSWIQAFFLFPPGRNFFPLGRMAVAESGFLN